MTGGFGTSRASASANRVYEHPFGDLLSVADLSATCARSHYLRDPWTFRCGRAQAWTVAGGKYKSDPKDEAAKSARASFDALGK